MNAAATSEVEWIDELPSHWKVLPLRALAGPGRTSFVDGDWIEAPFITDEGIRLLQTGNIGTGQFKEQGFRFVTDETFAALRCTEVRPGDVLICRLAEPVGRACLAPSLGSRMITSVDVCIMKPSPENDGRYIVYLLSSPDYLGFMEGQCRGGTRDRVSRSFLGSVRVPVPPYSEQAAIADFLDRETGKIDALVEEQMRLIELLKEKRQAVISHAVTKGLDPNVRMKPSGVEWLGDVPEHWEVLPLKRLGAFEAGAGFPDGEQGVEGEELPFFKVNALGKADAGVLVPPNDTVSRETATRLRAFVFPAGTIAFAKIGAALLLGRLRTTPCEACLDNNMMGYMVGAGHSPDFLIHAMSLVRFDLIANPGTVPSLNKSQIEGVTITVPPLEEQLAIKGKLRQRLADIDALAQVSEDAMRLLGERRSALISAAVTGKVDVRETAQEDAA